MSKPGKVVPTNRVSYDKQKDSLKAFGFLSEGGTKPVSNADVSRAVGVHDSTIRFTNEFFEGVGFLKNLDGTYLPAKEVVAYQLADEHGDRKAFYQLAPLLKRSWFAEAVLPKLKLGNLTVDEAIQTMSIASAAGKEFRGRLQMLISYLSDSGLVEVDGSTLKQGSESFQKNGVQSETVQLKQPIRVLEAVERAVEPTPAGGINLNFTIKVDPKEISSWSPEQITAFFGGLAQVWAAKGKSESS